MKTLITVIALALGTSVFAQKTTTQTRTITNPMNTSTTQTSTSVSDIPQSGVDIVGKVVYLKECPIYILAEINKETVKIHPTNLGTSFQVDGMKIKFNYKVVDKVEMPAECNFAAAVEVSNVKTLRTAAQ